MRQVRMTQTRFLPVLLLLFALTWTAVLPVRAANPPANLDVPADGITWTAFSNYGQIITQDFASDKLRLLVFFGISGACPNSNATLSGLAESGFADDENFQVIAIGSALGSVEPSLPGLNAYMETYLSQVSDRITYTWSSAGAATALRYLKAAGVASPDTSSFSYAVNIVLDRENHIRYAWTGAYDAGHYAAVQAALSGSGQAAPDGESFYTVNLTGLYQYDVVRPQLELINQARLEAGVSPLTLDAGLTEAAMRRAAELSIYFSHYRPDKSLAFTVDPRSSGENIAGNIATTEEVMEGWMSSEGHRENILFPKYQIVGIGSFVGSNGVIYWVQLFSLHPNEGGDVPYSPEMRTNTISTAAEYFVLPEFTTFALTLQAGETDINGYNLQHLNPTSIHSPLILAPTYAVSTNPDVATVLLDEDGTFTIQALTPGRTVISIGLAPGEGGAPWLLQSLSVTVSGVRTIPLLDAEQGEDTVGTLLVDDQDPQVLQITAQWNRALPEGSTLYLACYSGQALAELYQAPFQDGQAQLTDIPAQALLGSTRLMVLDSALRPLAQPVSEF